MRGPHNLGEFVSTQVLISISSGESEFYGLLRAAVEAKFLGNLLKWLEFDEQQEPPELVSDATAALGAAARIGVGKRMKHIDTQHLFIQKEVNERRLKLVKVKGEDNPADAGTKPLAEPRLKRLLEMVGVKFLVAAVIAARARTAEAAELAMTGAAKAAVTQAQEVSLDVVMRLRGIAEGSWSAVDVVLLVVAMLLYELTKEVLKAIVVEKIREAGGCKLCTKRRAATDKVVAKRTGKRKVLHTTGQSAMLHKDRNCKQLRCARKEIKPQKLCLVCDGEETDHEEGLS